MARAEKARRRLEDAAHRLRAAWPSWDDPVHPRVISGVVCRYGPWRLSELAAALNVPYWIPQGRVDRQAEEALRQFDLAIFDAVRAVKYALGNPQVQRRIWIAEVAGDDAFFRALHNAVAARPVRRRNLLSLVLPAAARSALPRKKASAFLNAPSILALTGDTDKSPDAARKRAHRRRAIPRT